MPGWARKIPPDWAPSGDAPRRRWLVPSLTEPGSAWPPNGHLRWPWACATSRCACCPSSFARSLAAVLDRTAHERPAGSGNPLTIASNKSGLHPVRPRSSPRVAAAAQLCACLARKARRPGEGRRSSPFVSFRGVEDRHRGSPRPTGRPHHGRHRARRRDLPAQRQPLRGRGSGWAAFVRAATQRSRWVSFAWLASRPASTGP